MATNNVLNYLTSTAVQLSAFPQALQSLFSQRKLPTLPTNADAVNAGVQTVMTSLIAVGVSALAQHIGAGSRLGLFELNWSSLGSALITGAAIGASIGVATYLARQGHRVREMNQERTSMSSQSNVGLQQIEQQGPDPWVINRILEKDPKAIPRLQEAAIAHAMAQTHGSREDTLIHSAISLGCAMAENVGQFGPNVAVVKKAWATNMQTQLQDTPSAQLLFHTLSNMPAVKKEASVVEMHAAWNDMVKDHVQNPSDEKLRVVFNQWTDSYFKSPGGMDTAVIQGCAARLSTIAQDPILVAQVNRESANTRALVASSLLGTRVQAVHEKDALEAITAPGTPFGPSM